MQLEELINGVIRGAHPKKYDVATGYIEEVQGNTCTVFFDNNAPLYNVRLQAVPDAAGDYIRILPKVGSAVVVAMMDGLPTEACLIQCSEIDGVTIVTGTKQFTVNSTGILLQGGTDTVLQALTLVIQSIMQIMVLYGNNPNYLQLQQSLEKLNNILQ